MSATPPTPAPRPLARLQTLLFLLVIVGCGIAAVPGVRSFPEPVSKGLPPGLVVGDYAKRFETHYDEAFPLKRFAVNLWAAISLRLFGEGRPGVVLGRDGWLYSDEEFRVTDDSAANLAANLATIRRLHDELAARALPLLVIVVPAKARVEAGHLAERKPAALHAGLHDHLIESLAIAGIPAVDLLGRLTQAGRSQPVFLRGDTHWTPFGALQAAQQTALIASERRYLDHPPRAANPQAGESATVPYRGDLYSFLPLDPWFAAWLPPLERLEAVPDAESGPAPAASADLFGSRDTPQIVLIGTSYSANPAWNFDGALAAAFGEPVTNLAREGHGPFEPMQQYLDGPELAAAQPRLVLWEIPERSLLMTPTTRPTPSPQAATVQAGITAD